MSNSSNDNRKTSISLSQTHRSGNHGSVSSQMVKFFWERTTLASMSTNEGRIRWMQQLMTSQDIQAQHDGYDHLERHGNLFSPWLASDQYPAEKPDVAARETPSNLKVRGKVVVGF